MIGAIFGDIIGSVFEWDGIKTTNFDLFNDNSTFTDDSVMNIATARSLMENRDYATEYRSFGRKYPDAGYGSGFNKWVFSDTMGPYNSFGNGSAMRVSPIGFAFNDLDTVLSEAKKSAEVTHNHPEGIKGAQATAQAILMARKGSSKDEIRKSIQEFYNYNLTRTCDNIRPVYSFDGSCQGTVPEAIVAFLDSDSFEDAIRRAVSLGGDADTLACITGGIAQAFYKMIPKEIGEMAFSLLPNEFLKTIVQFNTKYGIKISCE